MAKHVGRSGRILQFVMVSGFVVLAHQNCSRFDATNGGSFSSTSSTTNTSDSSSTPSPATPAPSVPTIEPFWRDEFDSFSLYDAKKNTGNWAGTSLVGTDGGIGWGAEYDVSPLDATLASSVFKIANGYLTIRMNKADAATQAKIGGRQYTAGAIRTRSPEFGYAYYEMRAQLPKGNGLWPAFWLLPADGAWPPEIDIVEGLGNSPSVVYTTVHSTLERSGWSKMGEGHYQMSGAPDVKVDTTSGMHTYGCDFRADYITWYFDGQQIYKAPTPSDLVNRKVFIILDSALGGWNGNAVDASTPFPADFTLDYIRVYSQIP